MQKWGFDINNNAHKCLMYPHRLSSSNAGQSSIGQKIVVSAQAGEDQIQIQSF